MREIILTRRDFIRVISGAAIIGGFHSSLVQGRANDGHEVIWGGVGFSRPTEEINDLFPLIHKAMNRLGGFHVVEEGFINQLKSNYKGEGVVHEEQLMRLADVEGALVFQVVFDSEYLNRIPSGFADSGKEHLTVYLFAQAQVLYLKSPDSGSDGEIRVLYSFPFRVSRSGASRANDVEYLSMLSSQALMDGNDSLTSTFGQKVMSKAFRESFIPHSIQVSSVSISNYASGKLNELSIADDFDEQFWGQAFTSSLAMGAGISMFPFRSNDSFGVDGIASKFDESSKVLSMASSLEKNFSEQDYLVEIIVHKMLRKPNGSSATNVLYSRGMSVYVKVINNNFGETVFNKKIFLIESHELPKHNFSLISQYDRKYLMQIAIKLFDIFGSGVINEDWNALAKIGLKNDDRPQVTALRRLLQSCKYQ